ncbi:MAG: LytTR family transcriptional regulator, partial [Lachnospiraceae bacterium]|nr:LytTR family transcriptional regulator [Lachnospiraceae bacterium]
LIRCRLTDIELKLPSENFIKIHRSYIVNASYIYLIGRSSVSLTTGEDLPLSRNRVQEVRRAFLLFAGDN